MVQTVKRALKKVVRTSLTSSELHTVLVEIEGAVNERPLAYVSDDADSLSPLTPASFGFFNRTYSKRKLASRTFQLRTQRIYIRKQRKNDPPQEKKKRP